MEQDERFNLSNYFVNEVAVYGENRSRDDGCLLIPFGTPGYRHKSYLPAVLSPFTDCASSTYLGPLARTVNVCKGPLVPGPYSVFLVVHTFNLPHERTPPTFTPCSALHRSSNRGLIA